MRSLKDLAQLALNVQDACNLSGVVHSFSGVITDVRANLEAEGKGGTDAVNQHPICVLFSSKIASLTNSETSSTFSLAYEWAKNEVRSPVERVYKQADDMGIPIV
jgi:hypothetical protein